MIMTCSILQLFVFVLLFCYNTITAKHCLNLALEVSQACTNNNILYFSTEGLGSGYGSEFNFYLVHVYLDAVYTNKRLVMVRPPRAWEYDCPDNLGWGCYLTFPCSDSIDTQRTNFTGVVFHNKGMSSHDETTMKSRLQEAYKVQYGLTDDNNICDKRSIDATEMTAMVAKYMYVLNSKTTGIVKKYNSVYDIDSKYVSLQIRTTDKHAEMDDESWEFANNMTKISDLVKTYINSNNNKQIYPSKLVNVFIATDNCKWIGEITTPQNLNPLEYKIVSACTHVQTNSNNTILDKSKSNVMTDPQQGDPIRGSYAHTLRLIAEIEMLVGGAHFFGAVQSNFVRMVYRLRYPDMNTFTMFPSKRVREDINLQLQHMPN